jgi:hypothetical protein
MDGAHIDEWRSLSYDFILCFALGECVVSAGQLLNQMHFVTIQGERCMCAEAVVWTEGWGAVYESVSVF